MWERNAFSTGSVNFDDNLYTTSQRNEQHSPLPGNYSIESHSHSNRSSQNDVHQSLKHRHQIDPSISNGQSTNRANHESISGHNSYQFSTKRQQLNQHNNNHHHHHHQHHQQQHYHSHHKSNSPSTSSSSISSPFQKNFNSALYKTELCRQYIDIGHCDYAEKCLFAHGKNELKELPKYRRICVSWANGYCQFGSNCMFMHHDGRPTNVTDSHHRRISPNGHSQDHVSHRPSKMSRNGHY